MKFCFRGWHIPDDELNKQKFNWDGVLHMMYRQWYLQRFSGLTFNLILDQLPEHASCGRIACKNVKIFLIATILYCKMVSDKFSTHVILFYSYKLFVADWYWSKKFADSLKLRKILSISPLGRLELYHIIISHVNISSWVKFPKQCNGIAASCF